MGTTFGILPALIRTPGNQRLFLQKQLYRLALRTVALHCSSWKSLWAIAFPFLWRPWLYPSLKPDHHLQASWVIRNHHRFCIVYTLDLRISQKHFVCFYASVCSQFFFWGLCSWWSVLLHLCNCTDSLETLVFHLHAPHKCAIKAGLFLQALWLDHPETFYLFHPGEFLACSLTCAFSQQRQRTEPYRYIYPSSTTFSGRMYYRHKAVIPTCNTWWICISRSNHDNYVLYTVCIGNYRNRPDYIYAVQRIVWQICNHYLRDTCHEWMCGFLLLHVL